MPTLRLDDAAIRSLSANELAVLKFVYENPDTLPSMSIQEFSKRVSYSPATILRFCRKLGFSGYAEFKYALRASLESGGEPGPKEENPLSWLAVKQNLLSDIEGTASLIEEDQLSAALLCLDSQRPLYLWAPGGITSITTDYFEKMLFTIGRQNVYRIESAKMGEHILQTLDPDNIFFVISASGSFGPSVRLTALAAMKRLTIISVTPYASNDIAEMADISFRFFTRQRENSGAEFTSRLPIFFTLNLIIKSYLQYKQSQNQEETL